MPTNLENTMEDGSSRALAHDKLRDDACDAITALALAGDVHALARISALTSKLIAGLVGDLAARGRV